MTQSARRGWCPSLGAPMATGDGLLARLAPRHGLLSPAQLSGVARAAREHGNGQIEITMRGNLQIRGLTERSAPLTADAVAALGIEAEPSPEIRISPLASLDAGRRSALGGMAGEIRARLAGEGLTEGLAPKFAIAIDEADPSGLTGLTADIRLTRLTASGEDDYWSLAIAGDAHSARLLGEGDRKTVLAAVITLVRIVAGLDAHARARDLPAGLADASMLGLCPTRIGATERPRTRRLEFPGDSIALSLALAFGQIEANDLIAFSSSLPRDALVCMAPGHAILVGYLEPSDASAVLVVAEKAGMIAGSEDVRLRIFACAGAPACGLGHLATRPFARLVAAEAQEVLASISALYVAGCSKQCGKPTTAHVALIGDAEDVRIEERDGCFAETHRRRLYSLSKQFAVARSVSR